MSALKASAISLSLFGVLLSFVAFQFALQTVDRTGNVGLGLACLGFAVMAAACLFSGALLTAVQPFVPGATDTRPASSGDAPPR
jgi:hypothetical protein